jgi:uncharacterized protein
LLAAADLLEEAAAVVVAGEQAHPFSRTLAAAATATADPAVVVVRAAAPYALPPTHPAFGKPAGSTGAVAYICRRNVCGLPIVDGDALRHALTARAG